MTPYLPHLSDLLAVLVTWGIGAVLLLAGAGLTGRRVAAEYQIAAGWGALCLLLTGWGVFVPLSLRIPAFLFGLASLSTLLLPSRRPNADAWRALGRMLVVSLPLWLLIAPIRPSQPDTFLNLLPNSFYLVDYGRLPTAALPPSFSLLPAAPYNTQFLSFLGALLDPTYPASGMSLINVLLQLVAGLAMARALGSGQTMSAPSWNLTAAGFLLATLLNPGFVPRIHFAAYGEPTLAATAVLAAWLFVSTQGELAAGQRPAFLLPLALVMAAMVNIKQTGCGLGAALAGAAVATSSAERGVRLWAAVRYIALVLLPAILLYAVWRYHVAHAGVAELSPLAFSDWNWNNLSETAASALRVVFAKPVYFGCVVIALSALPLLLSRHGWTATTRLLAFNAALFALYNIFIFVTYIAAFPTEMSSEAHSYFRYNTHLSLVLVLSLALTARDLGVVDWKEGWGRLASAGVLTLALLAPVLFVKRLRFDLDMPQPLVWNLAKRLADYVKDGDRLALLLPGDNDSVATMISGVLRDTPPRRPRLDLLRRDTADADTLEEAVRLGYSLVFVSCTPKKWRDLPGSEAVLLRHADDGWHTVAMWPYPAGATKQRWQHILAWAPLCRQS
ncbi:MAG TPA: hypothetical protein VE687_08860 [Stellaceae bacterium]|nr:hypothetical protein [Stellaceae bacterium]